MKTLSFNQIFLLIIFSFMLAAGQSYAVLLPDAQEVIKKGIIATKQQDYLMAIRYFQEARTIAPDAQEIFFNLGLVESKIPGRELRAIAWFGAYLAAKPNAPNAAAVEDQINALDVKSQSNLLHLIQTAQNAVDLREFRNAHLKILAQSDIARDQAAAGDIAGAQKAFQSELESAKQIQDAFSRNFAESSIAEAQAQTAVAQAIAGDIAGAKITFDLALRTADLIHGSNDSTKGFTQAHIAENQVKAGDIVGAQRTIKHIHEPDAKNYALAFIPKAQKKTGSTEAIFPSVVSVVPTITVTDWLNKLDDADQTHECALNTVFFLDLVNYLKSFPLSDASANVMDEPLSPLTDKIVNAQNIIDQMIKEQKKEQQEIIDDPCNSTPAIGTVCTGDAIYAGQYNGHKYMTTPSVCTNQACIDAGGTYPVQRIWSDDSETTGYNVITGATDLDNGKTNTSLAANYAVTDVVKQCQYMNYGGYTDWYLPAKNELNFVLYANKAALGGFMPSAYWSSTEASDSDAWFQDFSSGNEDSKIKETYYYFRCVRNY